MAHLAPTFVAHTSYPGDTDTSHYTDLHISDGILYATTDYDGNVEAWDISGSNLSKFSTEAHYRSVSAGSTAKLIGVELGGQDILLSGGGSVGALSKFGLGGTGAINT